MNRKRVLWIIPAVLLAVSVPVYRSLVKASPDRGSASTSLEAPDLMVSHAASNVEREHEIKALKGELEKNPDHVPILLRLAQVSRDAGKLNDSIRYLRDAVTQNPNHVDANLELGRALFETGDVDGAIRATQQVLETSPAHADALYNLGAIYGNMSQDVEARKYWEKVVAVAPDSESGRRAKENLPKLK